MDSPTVEEAVAERTRLANAIVLNLIEYRQQPDAVAVNQWRRADKEVKDAIDRFWEQPPHERTGKKVPS